jgi:hypothetical protein
LERLAALTDGASALWMEGRSAPPGMLSMLVGPDRGYSGAHGNRGRSSGAHGGTGEEGGARGHDGRRKCATRARVGQQCGGEGWAAPPHRGWGGEGACVAPQRRWCSSRRPSWLRPWKGQPTTWKMFPAAGATRGRVRRRWGGRHRGPEAEAVADVGGCSSRRWVGESIHRGEENVGRSSSADDSRFSHNSADVSRLKRSSADGGARLERHRGGGGRMSWAAVWRLAGRKKSASTTRGACVRVEDNEGSRRLGLARRWREASGRAASLGGRPTWRKKSATRGHASASVAVKEADDWGWACVPSWGRAAPLGGRPAVGGRI